MLVDGSPVAGAPSSYTFTNVTAAGHTISVSFAIDSYTLTYTALANGSISGTRRRPSTTGRAARW